MFFGGGIILLFCTSNFRYTSVIVLLDGVISLGGLCNGVMGEIWMILMDDCVAMLLVNSSSRYFW
jgi:hypothetical protein